MKITAKTIDTINEAEVKRIMAGNATIKRVFGEQAFETIFYRPSYTSDGASRPTALEACVTLKRIADDCEKTVDLTIGDVKRIIAKDRHTSSKKVDEAYDSKSTGDGDGSSIHRLIGFTITKKIPGISLKSGPK